MRFLAVITGMMMLALPAWQAGALQSPAQEAEFSASRLLIAGKQFPAAVHDASSAADGSQPASAPTDAPHTNTAPTNTALTDTPSTPASSAATPTTLQTVLEITLKEGWKTYWRSPGDAGFPFVPELLPTASNISSIEVHWPFPQRFIEEWGLEVFGYKDRLLLPIRFTLDAADVDTRLDLTINYAVCSDICINEQQEHSLVIPADFTRDEAHAALFAKSMQSVPAANGEHGLTIQSATILSEQKEGGILQVVTHAPPPHRNTELFIEGDAAGLRFPQATTESDSDGTIRFSVPYELSLPAKTLGGETLRLTFIHHDKAVETTLTLPKHPPKATAAKTDTPTNDAATNAAHSESSGKSSPSQPESAVPSAAAPAGTSTPSAVPSTDSASVTDVLPKNTIPDSHTEESSLAAMLLLALLGGLVLNIMPCVLPVLSLKILGAVKHGGRHHSEVRKSFLASVAGILAFFLVLAGLTILAKNAGQAVGWGFHFQSPQFLTFLTVLIALFAANLLGWFEIQLPDWLNSRLYDMTDTGAKQHRHHLTGDFMTGMFAALMATPCTAPFLGTAVGFALSRGEAEIVSIFFMLGVGLALPYLAAALMPSLATRLPKPGAWMLRVKQFMGVLMALAVLWLLWVIAGQTHPAIAAGVLMLSALLGMVMHGGGRWRGLRKPHNVVLIAAGLLVALAFLPSLKLSPHQDGQAQQVQAVWQPFDRAAIAQHVASGAVVFVDVTADWCLTCKYNKLRVLDRDPFMARLQKGDFIAMRADMTRPVPEIQDFLREYGRYGIPFNIVYGPAAPEGIPLSEILDDAAVMRAINLASGH